MICACIGMRDLTHSEYSYLKDVGRNLARAGCIITSGNAPGADQAYAEGASEVNPGLVELYLPWKNFNMNKAAPGNLFWTADQARPEHISLAARAHPIWDKLKDPVKKLMIRNAMIIRRFDKQVDQVIAWPNVDRRGGGGTGHGMLIASILKIPVWLIHEGKWWNPIEGIKQKKGERE